MNVTKPSIAINVVKNYVKVNVYLNAEFITATLSKTLDMVLVLGSLLAKIPQIIKIWRSKSGEGISIISVTLNLFSLTIYTSYSFMKEFPFSAWGDRAFLAIQTVIIGILILYYQGDNFKAALYLMCYIIFCYILMGKFMSSKSLWTLQGFNVIVSLSGKLAQVFANYKNGHTGNLSAITLLTLFFGSTTKIFTTVHETKDRMALITHFLSSFVNIFLVFQLLYYWNVKVVKKKLK